MNPPQPTPARPGLLSRLRPALLLSLLALPCALASSAASPASTASPLPWNSPGATNPILPGYFADPSIISHEGRFYLYATLDPWGGDTLGCWESPDLKNWEYRHLPWPNKKDCTSPTSKGAKVWAPSVVRAPDGRFHMFVSVGSEVWVGVADHPLGPWSNPLGNRPLIPADFRPGFHMIDAEAFIDDDGQAYLYWGSGWGWKNGRCFAARLNARLDALEGEVHDVTPPDYFEGPFMFRRGGRYYLTWSEGRTDRDTYNVRYATGDTPFGPFTPGTGNPILKTDTAVNVVSPGHHAVLAYQGSHYILYHRQSVPFVQGEILRQTCVATLSFAANGSLLPVVPAHQAPAPFARDKAADGRNRPPSLPVSSASASSQLADHTRAGAVLDDNFATRWAPAADDTAPWLTLDLGFVRSFSAQELRPEYPWKQYDWILEASDDGLAWRELARSRPGEPAGSPLRIPAPGKARHLRLRFPRTGDTAPALFEWRCLE